MPEDEWITESQLQMKKVEISLIPGGSHRQDALMDEEWVSRGGREGQLCFSGCGLSQLACLLHPGS